MSISHPQTKGHAFPWRVFDIMASNGVLISSESSLLNTLTQGIVKVPMFSNQFEARALCKKFLQEENMRADVVAASNEFIEKHGRWGNNFKVMQEVLGLSLINEKKTADEDLAHNIIGLLVETNKPKSVYRVMLKTNTRFFRSSFFFLLVNLPLINKLFSTKKKQKISNYFKAVSRL